MTDRVARLTAIALVVAVLVAGVGATGSATSAQQADTVAGTQVDPDDVSIGVDLREDGSAAWTIEYRVRLDDDNTTQAFESLRDDIRADDTQYVSDFRARMVATADAAENATDRRMEIRNVSVEATRQELPQEYGVLTYSFVWTNFASVDNGSITAGDALVGFFLDAETSLQLSWPAGYGIETAQPDPDDVRAESRIVVWNGPVDFGANELTLVVSEQATGDVATTATGDGGDAGGGNGDAGGGGLPLGVIAALGVVIAVAAGVLYRQQGGGSSADGSGSPTAAGDVPRGTGGDAAAPSDASESSASASEGGDGTAAESAGVADADAPDSEADPTDAGGDNAGAAAGAAAADDGDDPPWADELLSNEEQVLALVEHEGGRMKQQEVAQTLEWTDAKTSQVVRKMRDEDTLDAFRLGRENVLVLPDEDFGPTDEDV